MSEAASIVRATTANLVEASELVNEYNDAIGVIHRDSPEALLSYLADPACGFWIARVNNVAAGCVALRPLTKFASAVECKRLFVRPEFRRRGIAELLMTALEEHAQSGGMEWVYLDSKDDLEGALALYRRTGYVACDRYNDNSQATVFMRKQLYCSALAR